MPLCQSKGETTTSIVAASSSSLEHHLQNKQFPVVSHMKGLNLWNYIIGFVSLQGRIIQEGAKRRNIHWDLPNFTVVQKYSHSFLKPLLFTVGFCQFAYLKSIEKPVYHFGPWSQVGQFLAIPAVWLTDRTVPSSDEKGKLEALDFLKLLGGRGWGKSDFLHSIF